MSPCFSVVTDPSGAVIVLEVVPIEYCVTSETALVLPAYSDHPEKSCQVFSSISDPPRG
ncbi:MAG: hypothetical protein WBD22_12435 [Pyrinomonadaceae bacterium]